MKEPVGGDRQTNNQSNLSRHSRAQSEVLAGILIVGIIFISAGTVAIVAVDSFATPQEQAVDRAIEDTLFSLRSTAIDVGLNGETTKRVKLQSPEEAQLSIDPNATTIRVIHEEYDPTDPEAEQTLYETTLGTLEMSVGQRTYAFEGGGIYRTEDAQTQVIAAPPLVYRGVTANLAILKLDGTDMLDGARSIQLGTVGESSHEFPNGSRTYEGSTIPFDNPVLNGSVKLEVQSEHYMGWHAFFESQGAGTVSVDHERQTVTMELESISEVTPETAITYQDDYYTRGNPTVEGDVDQAEFLIDTRSVIDSHLSHAADENDNGKIECVNATQGITSPCSLEAGTYFFNSDLQLTGDLEINTTGGDVILAIDGDFTLENNEIVVTGDRDHTVTYYVANNLGFQGGASVYTSNEEPESYRNAFVIGEGFNDGTSGGGTVALDAIVYASNADVEINGNFQLTGSLHAKSVTLGGNDQIVYDESVEERILDFTAGATPVMFLHVAEHTVTVDTD